MTGRSAVRAGVLLVVAIGSGGCGGVYYAVQATSASSKLAEARSLGADHLAPYEYTYAKEHLDQAQVEASEASYSDAADFAEVAETYAQRAIDVAREKRSHVGGHASSESPSSSSSSSSSSSPSSETP